MNIEEIKQQIRELTKEERLEISNVLFEKEKDFNILNLALFSGYRVMKESQAEAIKISVNITDPESKIPLKVLAEYSFVKK